MSWSRNEETLFTSETEENILVPNYQRKLEYLEKKVKYNSDLLENIT